MSRLSPPTRLHASTVCQAVLLTVASATLWVLALAFVGGIVAEFAFNQVFEGQRHTFTFRKGGLPVWRIDSYRQGQVTKTEYQDLDGNLVEMTNKDERAQLIALVDTRIAKQHKRAVWRADVVPVNSSYDEGWFFEDFGTRGQFTLFDSRSKQRIGWVGLNGFSSTPLSVEQQFPTRSGNERAGFVGIGDDLAISLQWAMTRFEGSPAAGSRKLLIEPGGRRVHWIGLRERFSQVIHDGEPVLAACFDWPVDPQSDSMRVVLRTQNALHVVVPAAVPSPAASAVPLTTTPTVVETWRLPESVRHSALLQWERTPDGPLFVEPLFTEGWKLTWATPEGSLIRERVVPQRDFTAGGEEQGAWLTPLIQLPAFGDFMLWAMAHQEDVESSPIDHRRARELGLALASQRTDVDLNKFVAPVAVLHLSVALWSVLAVRRLRRFGASVGEQVFWGAWMLAFGVPGYLAFRVSGFRRMAALGRPFEISNLKFQISKPETAEGGHPTDTSANGVRFDEWIADSALALLARTGLSPGHAALVIKELRLAAIVGAAACGAYLLVVAKLTNLTGFGWMRTFVQESGLIPFLSDGFAQAFSVVTFLMAVGLAVWQTSSESRGGAWLFLLHRPVSRRAIVLSKLAVGLSVLLVCSAFPICLYAAWAAREGTHASPFEWGMTNETWRLWWSMPPVYLGTLLAMLRPARWFGTRLLPCAAGLWWIANRHAYNVAFWPTWLEGGVLLAIDLIFIACLLLVAREREYP